MASILAEPTAALIVSPAAPQRSCDHPQERCASGDPLMNCGAQIKQGKPEWLPGASLQRTVGGMH